MAFRLAKVDEISKDEGFTATGPMGEEIALYKKADSIFALKNNCPHAAARLARLAV